MDAQTIQADPAAVFNLAHYEAAETGILTIKKQDGSGPLKGPNGEPVTIELYGPGSEVYVMAQVEFDRSNSERTMQAMLGGKVDDDVAVAQRAAQTRKLVAITKAINNFPIPGGAKALYENRRLGYIRNQVVGFADSWANFPSESVKD